MKSLTIFTILLSVSSAFAYNFSNISNKDIPSENGWSKAMTSLACKVDFVKSDVGIMEESEKKGVVYTVYNKKGQVLASAWARSTFIGSQKRCLLK